MPELRRLPVYLIRAGGELITFGTDHSLRTVSKIAAQLVAMDHAFDHPGVSVEVLEQDTKSTAVVSTYCYNGVAEEAHV